MNKIKKERTVKELTNDELNELKEGYACLMNEEDEEGTSYGELIESHNISNEIIFEYYEGMTFVEEDFFCNIGEE